MVQRRLVCTICLEQLDIEQCKWLHPDTQDEGYAPPVKKRGQNNASHSAAYNEWRGKEWALHCAKGHLLPPESDKREMLVIGLFGETAAGKSAFIKALVRQLDIEEALSDLGITGRLAPAFKQTYKDEYLNKNEATQPAHEESPRKPIVMELTVNKRETLNLLIFDSAGDEGATTGEAHKQWKFAPIADVLLFFAPPAALGDLPGSIPRRGALGSQTLPETRDKFQAALQVAESNDRRDSARRKGVLPFFVLSKADQLTPSTGFPQTLLTPRTYRGRGARDVMEELNRETQLLLDFVGKSKGKILLSDVLSFNGTGRCIAVSGTGTDEGSARSGSSVRTGAPERCLDALLIALWENGFLGAVA